MRSEVRAVLRDIRRTPLFSLCVVATLVLGVGANTGAFSALHTLFLKPLPYPEPDRLVAINETTVDHKPRDVAEANLLDWRAQTHLFSAMAAYRPRSFGITVSETDAVTVIQAGTVMADFFHVLQVPPALGRVFREEEEIAEAPLIVLSDRLWRRLFAADPNVLGRTVWLNEEPRTVIGVMPAGFEYPMRGVLPEAYLPLSRKDYCCSRLGFLDAVGRVRFGVTLDAARAELESVAAELGRQYGPTNAGRSAVLTPLHEAMTGRSREPLWLLLTATGLLFLIGLANVAGLILARTMGRAHEIAVRIALGAGTRRLARLCFTEAAVWSAAGVAGGWVAADVVLRLVPRFVPEAELAGPLRLDGTAFAAACVLAVTATLLLGGVPTLFALRPDQNSLLKSGGRSGGRGSRSRARNGLAMVQVALSVVLLLSAALLLRSFLALVTVNPGFATAHALRFGIGLPEKRYETEQKLIDFHRKLLQRISELPGVVRVGAAGRFPFSGANGTGAFQIAGSAVPEARRPRVWISPVSPGYFAAMSIPLVEGRDFSWQDDREKNQYVAIVNQTFARTYLRNRPRVGTVIDARGTDWTIVGVVSDSRQASLDREPEPEIFLSLSQTGADGAVYVVRTRGAERAVAGAVASAVAQQDPRIQRVTPTPLRLVVERSLSTRKNSVALIGGFAGLALLLTAIGIYGVVAYRAAERSHEMAIRAALGATARHIRGLILGQGARIALAGASLGLCGFLAAAPLLRSQLYGVGLGDPLSLGVVLPLILGVALAASAVPSGRAAQTAPAELLRKG